MARRSEDLNSDQQSRAQLADKQTELCVWTNFGLTSSEELESGEENKENSNIRNNTIADSTSRRAPTDSFVAHSCPLMDAGASQSKEAEVSQSLDVDASQSGMEASQVLDEASQSLRLCMDETQSDARSPPDMFQEEEEVTCVPSSPDDQTDSGSHGQITSQNKPEDVDATQYIDVVGSASQESAMLGQLSASSSSSQGLDDSVQVISASPRHRDISIVNISDDSKNESIKLELSDSAPRASTQSAQLSAILAPNSLLYGDLDNIIDNDEDVQDMSNMIGDMEDDTQPNHEELKENSIDISVFGLPSHQRLELADMSPMKEIRRQLAAATASSVISYNPVGAVKTVSAASTVTAANTAVVSTADATATMIPVIKDTAGVAPIVAATPVTVPSVTTVVAKAVEPTPVTSASSSVAVEVAGAKRKRTAVDASLSSADEDNRKRVDNRVGKIEEAADSSQRDEDSMTTIRTQKPDEATAGLKSLKRGLFTNGDVAGGGGTPDISCSPIVGEATSHHHANHSDQDMDKRRRTSTPGTQTKKYEALPTPQKLLRQKLRDREEESSSTLSMGEEEKTADFDTPPVYSPAGLVPSFKLPESPPAKLHWIPVVPQEGCIPLHQLRDMMARAGWSPAGELVVGEKLTLRPNEEKLNKRLSDVSMVSRSSSGASSGYLAGSSSGVSSISGSSGIRSRLSIMPESVIEPHHTVAPLPSTDARRSAAKVYKQTTETEDSTPPKLETIKEETKQSKLYPSSRNGARRGRAAGPKKETKRKRAVKGWTAIQTSEEEEDQEQEQETAPAKLSSSSKQQLQAGSSAANCSAELRLEPGSKVFARWVDPAGVYFYAAEVVELVGDSEVRVRFLEDSIQRVVKREGELIAVGQLSPGDQVTVKHDEYAVYDVTATLIAFPTGQPDGDVRYELNITATESEPASSEDSRTVSFTEISLTDNQASLIIRHLGLVPTSNKVSCDINFENLIFGKRKPRILHPSPSTTPSKCGQSASDITPGKRTPRSRRRGGSNADESATSGVDTSTLETTPRRKKTAARVRLGGDEELEHEKEKKRGKVTSSKPAAEPATLDTSMFKGMCFVLTQAKYAMPMTEPDDSDSACSPDQLSDKFDKAEIRSIILGAGGRILQEFPSQHNPVNTLGEELLTISDRVCLTMNYLLSLAHSVPVVSYRYVLSCQVEGVKLDYRKGYLLPAGWSSLLMRKVEQGCDYRAELRMNGCLLPSPVSTRLSSKGAEADQPRRSVLSGIHVLVISLNKGFADDWQSVLDSLGARVTKRISPSAQLALIRDPDVVVTDSRAPRSICQELRARRDIPVVSTSWVIQCVVNNARVAYQNFTRALPH